MKDLYYNQKNGFADFEPIMKNLPNLSNLNTFEFNFCIPNAENLEPAYIVFENYEKILQWNRSLRFALAVCTLKGKFDNVL